MKTVQVEAAIKIPAVPNYLTIEDNHKISIADVSDSDLRKIGAEWIKNLIKHKNEIIASRPATIG